jgi:hypothetical protein
MTWRRLLFAAALGYAQAALAQAGDLSNITCPSATEEPPKAALGAVTRRPRDYVRYWPRTWVCEPRMDAVANLWLAQVKQETDGRTGDRYHVVEPFAVPEDSPWPRWHARLSWKMLMPAVGAGEAPATLVVKADYEQPSLARFDMFVSLTAKGVTGISSRVLNESTSEDCLRTRDDCRHSEEIVLKISSDALHAAVRTGLLIDLLGHGRSERLAIPKEAIWAFSVRSGLRETVKPEARE